MKIRSLQYDLIGNKSIHIPDQNGAIMRSGGEGLAVVGARNGGHRGRRAVAGLWQQGVGPFGDFELIFGASRLGLKICEVPTRYRPRTYGVPKSKIVSHGLMLLRMAARATRVFKCR